MKTMTKIILGAVLAILGAFVLQNWAPLVQSIEFRLVGSQELPLWIWLMGSFGMGWFFWYSYTLGAKRNLKKTIRQRDKEIKELTSELNKYRNLSIKDEFTSDESAIAPPEPNK